MMSISSQPKIHIQANYQIEPIQFAWTLINVDCICSVGHTCDCTTLCFTFSHPCSLKQQSLNRLEPTHLEYVEYIDNRSAWFRYQKQYIGEEGEEKRGREKEREEEEVPKRPSKAR